MRKGSLILSFALTFFLLTAYLVEPAFAQPGYIPSVKELETQLQPTLDELAIQMGNDQLNMSLYLQRAHLYLRLHQRAGYQRTAHTSYADKAFADLNTAIGLNPTAEMYVLRAGLQNRNDEPLPPNPEAGVVVDRHLKAYDASMADLQCAIDISKDDYEMSQNRLGLAALYFARARALARPPEMAELRARDAKYSVWDDLEKGIELAKRANEYGSKSSYPWQKQSYRENVGGAYAGKARVAHEIGELDMALDAYREGEKYFDGSYSDICNYYSSWGDALMKKKMFTTAAEKVTRVMTLSEASAWNCRHLLSRRAAAYEAAGQFEEAIADYTTELGKNTYDGTYGQVSIKRAKLYLKLGQPAKAVADLDYALGQSFHKFCPAIFRLRAQAKRRLGDLDGAEVDESTAANLRYISESCVEQ